MRRMIWRCSRRQDGFVPLPIAASRTVNLGGKVADRKSTRLNSSH